MHRLAVALLVSLAAIPLVAQSAAPVSQQARPIKALSEEQVAQYRAGAGMGLATAAELNGYPGPKHLLELSNELALSEEQQTVIRKIHDEMKAEAIALGEKVIAAEAQLDRLFASKDADLEEVKALTASLGELSGKLRFAHLRAHLATFPLLSPEQVVKYEELRGYRQKRPHHH